MVNLGNITKISGAAAPPVNVIIGGLPCQDLSIAGGRKGLGGERSGLFMEQIRIIKEMRDKDVRNSRTAELVRPRFMVWENVPGAFSSTKGEDFRTVLEETARIADPGAVIPRPPKGKWKTSGAIMGDGWSIAWRVLDAQFWGVPQRRRRIVLVADFGGKSAPEILFERKGVSGDITESGMLGEGAAATAEGGAGVSSKSAEKHDASVLIYDARGNGDGSTVPTLTGDHQSRVTDYTAICCEGYYAYQQFGKFAESAVASTCQTHDAKGYSDLVVKSAIVRRLTPLECERLQGFPDGWTDIGEWTDSKGKKRKCADSARYKALGNSIALPPWTYVLRKLSHFCDGDYSMASLFDGIGGFPLIWERLHGRGHCLWTSEIEEFPCAVTRIRFEEETK